MRYTILYLPQVRNDIRHLAPDVKRLIQAGLEEISWNPHVGAPLVRELKGLWKYRAKRYRIVYEIRLEKKEVVVYLIDQRKSVYDRVRQMLKRWSQNS